MRASSLFARTLREIPSDAEMVSHQLSMRAGLIRRLAVGIYSYLPMGLRVINKIEQILREEMDAVDGQEIQMPVVNPAEVWRATGRYDAPAPGPALLRFTDRGNHEMVLAMTHEEVVTDLARQEISSYKQLPAMVYQIQTKFRDEPRSRGGLVRVREFLMKDGYSFHADWESLDAYYPRVYDAYKNIFRRCGLDAVAVEADSGMMGGSGSHEFISINDSGEDTLVFCPTCRYAANAEAAIFDKGTAQDGELLDMELVATPNQTTIEQVAAFLGIETRQTLKAVFYSRLSGEVVFVIIRGDLAVNEQKLSNVLGGEELHASTAEELAAAGLVAGYASPVGISDLLVVADDSAMSGTNFVGGANKPGYHYLNVNYGRDFEAKIVADIALAREGDHCAHCGGTLTEARGIEVGHVFKLGTKYSEAVGANFLDADGVAQPLIMGCYGIGLGRLLACVIEEHHDDQGIIWPVSIAPFQVHLVSLAGNNQEVASAAEALYARLLAAGYEVFFDDRDERAGVKFNDADLIGIPVRVTVSKRMMDESAFEVKARWADDRTTVPSDQLEAQIDAILENPPF